MTQPLKSIVSRNIRSIRIREGLSQLALAEKSGLSVRYISRVENDPPDITLCNIERIAKGLGVAPSELLKSLTDELPKPNKKTIEAIDHVMRLLAAYKEMS